VPDNQRLTASHDISASKPLYFGKKVKKSAFIFRHKLLVTKDLAREPKKSEKNGSHMPFSMV
jgi:hypothetical protein